MKRINVIGTSGSGKSTFSRKLAEKLGYPYIELDALFWGPNWTEPTDEELFERLEKAMEQECWVLDGNYSRTNSLKWSKADTIVWIDLSFPRTLWQSIKRAISRIISQEELWPGTGNKESLRLFFSKDSVVLHSVKVFHRNRIRYGKLMKDPAYGHIKKYRLTSHKASRKWLEEVSSLRKQ